MILDPELYDGYKERKKNELDYIEIGTCDWDTFSMTKKHLKGVIVEPIKLYLDNIPNNSNVIKMNYAISNNNCESEMYYIPPNIIEEKKIVNCFRGMNKLGEYHMGHVSENLIDNVVKEKCNVITFFKLLDKLQVSYVDFLKIDTEGHDCAILNNTLDNLPNDYVLPRYLYFENN